MENRKPVKVAADVMWASLSRPNEMSGAYQVELTNLSPQAVAALEELGVEAKKKADKPEKGFYITCKSKHPIRAYDTNGDEILVNVGNGSRATAVISSYAWTFKNKKGISPSLLKLVITDLVTFGGDGATEMDEEEAL